MVAIGPNWVVCVVGGVLVKDVFPDAPVLVGLGAAVAARAALGTENTPTKHNILLKMHSVTLVALFMILPPTD
ncbi:MAG TPA: hypothetical protein VMB52_04840 [Verrucomicrobiae bacterium]|nr:hypothetical protein [Verrucomicrobiae bacterium]